MEIFPFYIVYWDLHSSIDTRGKILFLEDLDEYLYHVDRMMMNLKRNGYFDEINGVC